MVVSVTEGTTLTVPAGVAKKTSENRMRAHVTAEKSCEVQEKEAGDGLRKRALTRSYRQIRTRDTKEGGST